MLGEAVYARFSARHEVRATDLIPEPPWLASLDVRDLGAMTDAALAFEPDLIVNLSAHTDLEYCERNEEDAFLTNGLGQENACLVADRMGIPAVYISTAGVFDGEKEFYTDFDAPRPINVYGRSKFYGEQVTQSILNRSFIFRAGWMMGGGPVKDKKFVNKIYKQLEEGKRELQVVDDKLGTPTYTWAFADKMLDVIDSGQYGLYNMVCSGSCSRYDVAMSFVEALGMQSEVDIEKVDSGHFSSTYFAPRPTSEKLMTTKLVARGFGSLRNWEECLREYAKAFRVPVS
jgi:dTDP-4-dehydrorhamnose reductase